MAEGDARTYADLITRNPKRFKAFASMPMDAPDAALAELHRAINTLKLNGVILLSNIRGAPLTDPRYKPFFEEANREIAQICRRYQQRSTSAWHTI